MVRRRLILTRALDNKRIFLKIEHTLCGERAAHLANTRLGLTWACARLAVHGPSSRANARSITIVADLYEKRTLSRKQAVCRSNARFDFYGPPQEYMHACRPTAVPPHRAHALKLTDPLGLSRTLNSRRLLLDAERTLYNIRLSYTAARSTINGSSSITITRSAFCQPAPCPHA